MKKYIAFLLCICLMAGLVPASFAAETAFIDDPDAIEDSSYSVVMLYCYDIKDELTATGSGFAMFEDGIFVTNYHVIEGVESVIAYTEGGMYFEIESVVAVDKERDIAILKTNAKTRMTVLPIGNARDLKKGSRVIAIGSPQGLINSVSSGLLTGYVQIGDEELLQFDAAISEGSSGGALFNNSGEVIGITSSGLVEGNNLNFAVPIEYAQELWDKYLAGETAPVEDTPQETAYKLLDAGDYENALAIFTELEDQEGINACNYLIGLQLAENKEYDAAMEIFIELSNQNYEDSTEVLNMIRCIYASELIESHTYGKMEQACNLLKRAIKSGSSDANELLPYAYEKMLSEGIEMFNEGHTSNARSYFEFLETNHSTKESSLYLTLIKIRSGTVNDSLLKILKNNISSSEVKDVLYSSQYAMKAYLKGKWRNENGYTMEWDSNGHLTDGMPKVISGSCYYEISGGILYCYTDKDPTRIPDKEIDIIDWDHWKIYCYENNKSYTMTRVS